MYRFHRFSKDTPPLPEFFAGLSGRDPVFLRQCLADERRSAALRGLALGVAVALHFAAMTAALVALNLPLALALPLAMLTAAGVFAADGTILLACDLDAAERAVRRIGAAHGPRLASSWGRIGGGMVRIVFALSLAPALALFLALHFSDPEIRARIAVNQQTLDAPFREQAQTALDTQRTRLSEERTVANREGGVLEDSHRTALAAHDARIAKAQERVARMDDRGDALLAQADRAEERARREREVALCERVGSGSDCAEPVSGESGEGKLFRRAIAQAADSARDAREDRARHAALIVERTAAIRALDTVLTLPRPPRPAALDAVQARQGAAQDAIIRFDAGRAAALMNLVAADPARPVLDPDSLALRLKTLHEMAREAPAFGVALGLIALSALALDLLPLTVAIATRPGAYHLYRGAALEDASRKEAIRRDAADITDAATREKADEVRWHGDDAMRDIRKRQRRKVAEMSLDSLRGKAA